MLESVSVYHYHDKIEQSCHIEKDKKRTVDKFIFCDCEDVPCENIEKIEKGENSSRNHEKNDRFLVFNDKLSCKSKCIQHQHGDETYLHHIECSQQQEVETDRHTLRKLHCVCRDKVERNIDDSYDYKCFEKFIRSCR